MFCDALLLEVPLAQHQYPWQSRWTVCFFVPAWQHIPYVCTPMQLLIELRRMQALSACSVALEIPDVLPPTLAGHPQDKCWLNAKLSFLHLCLECIRKKITHIMSNNMVWRERISMELWIANHYYAKTDPLGGKIRVAPTESAAA